LLKVGDPAPDFTLEDTNGRRVKLSDIRGKMVVLYFYPKDNTPGCTKEACSFRDAYGQYRSKRIEVLGVSLDDRESHENFASKFNLPFSLLSDTKAEVAKEYGVYVQKNMYGKKFWGIKRTTFVIDEKGRIKEIFDKVDCENHAKDVLKALAK